MEGRGTTKSMAWKMKPSHMPSYILEPADDVFLALLDCVRGELLLWRRCSSSVVVVLVRKKGIHTARRCQIL